MVMFSPYPFLFFLGGMVLPAEVFCPPVVLMPVSNPWPKLPRSTDPHQGQRAKALAMTKRHYGRRNGSRSR